MAIINQLSPITINRIAAGEVIVRDPRVDATTVHADVDALALHLRPAGVVGHVLADDEVVRASANQNLPIEERRQLAVVEQHVAFD